MSFGDRVRASQNFDPRRFLRFEAAGAHCGWIRLAFAKELARWRSIFAVGADAVLVNPDLRTTDHRTQAVARAVQTLHEEGRITGWRNELYPVAAEFGGPPLMIVERAAAYPFGIRTRAAHLTGYVGEGPQCKMWIARRAASKPIEPLMLDNLVGGGVGLGFSPQETILKECGEEAGIPPKLAAGAKQKSIIISRHEVVDGLHWEALHCFDLQLHEDFIPVNRDGEVAEFHLLPVREVGELIRDTGEFTVDAALVALDFLLRHDAGGISAGERAELMAALRAMDSRTA